MSIKINLKPGRYIKINLKPGRYIVCDPCYVLSNPAEKWKEILKKTGSFGLESKHYNITHGGKFKIGEYTLACYGTAHGDGVYSGYDHKLKEQRHRVFPVDAGCLACIPYDMISTDELIKLKNWDPEYLIFINSEKPIECYYENGTIHFGQLEIWTN